MALADVSPRRQEKAESPRFDLLLIGGTAALALGSGLVLVWLPALFPLLLLLDLWLLGYPHVISTFTRLCFDRGALRENRFHLFVLPLLVAIPVVLLVATQGVWPIVTLYFYWQWFHYGRQSWGILRRFERRAFPGRAASGGLPWSQLAFFAVPIWGVLNRSAQGAERFLGMDIAMLPVPPLVADIAGIVAIAVVAWGLVEQVPRLRQGRAARLAALFWMSHQAIFFIAYGAIASMDQGWLVVNVWHNAQYLLFVWAFNNKRYEGRVDPQARFLSTISQRRAWPAYALVCLAISTVTYLSLQVTLAAVIAPMVVFQIINFHHYVVDSRIWKSAAPPPRSPP